MGRISSIIEGLNNSNVLEYDEFLNIKRNLEKAFKTNDASHRGARIPSAIKSCINQISYDDQLRYKSCDIDIDYIAGSTIILKILWFTQEPFKNADSLWKEVLRWAKYTKKGLGFKYTLRVEMEVEARDGSSYGHSFYSEDV